MIDAQARSVPSRLKASGLAVAVWTGRNSLGLVTLGLVIGFLFVGPGESRVLALAPYAWPLAIVLLVVLLRAGIARIMEAVAYWVRERFQGFTAKTPTGEYTVDAGPPPKAEAAATSGGLPSGEPDPLADQTASVVLQTLWKYQHGTAPGVRWTYHSVPGHASWAPFLFGVGLLLRRRLVGIDPRTGQVFLTDAGLEYVRANEARMKDPPPFLDPFSGQ